MSSIHRRAIAFTLVIAGVAFSASAQRGGGMGHGGGGAGQSAPAFRASPQQFGASRNSSLSGNQRFVGRQGSAGYYGRRSGDERNGRGFYRPYYGPYGGGWLGLGYLGYPGIGFDDGSGYGDQAPPNSQAADYGPPPDAQPQYGPPPPDQPAAPSAPAYRPAYQSQQAQYDPAPEDPVTLVFKDGRPTEQISNYMLTRTTLYVQGKHLRQIPVDQLDMAATQKFNQDAGVEFQLPESAR